MDCLCVYKILVPYVNKIILINSPSTSYCRPQLLVLCKLNDSDCQPKYRRIFNLASQLKAGKGLTIVAAVLPGNYADRVEDATNATQVREILTRGRKAISII